MAGGCQDGQSRLKPKNAIFFKTKLCYKFGETGECGKGDECRFAHGIADLSKTAKDKYKTRMCPYKELCRYSPTYCLFAHSPDELRVSSKQMPEHVVKETKRRVLCPRFANGGSCHFGNKCDFAHGEEELQPKLCKYHFGSGNCPYGAQCGFAHDESEVQECMRQPRPRELPEALEKYWNQRYYLWHRFDEGIQMDEESWYSVVPEQIAKQIAERCRGAALVVDAFCGAGSSAIHLAATCGKVIAVDHDSAKLEMARHNAEIYGVEDKIDFVCADAFEALKKLENKENIDVVFVSPPWGADYDPAADSFDISSMPVDATEVFEAALRLTENIAFYVPRNTSDEQMEQLAGKLPVSVERNWRFHKTKTKTAFYGKLATKSNE